MAEDDDGPAAVSGGGGAAPFFPSPGTPGEGSVRACLDSSCGVLLNGNSMAGCAGEGGLSSHAGPSPRPSPGVPGEGEEGKVGVGGCAAAASKEPLKNAASRACMSCRA